MSDGILTGIVTDDGLAQAPAVLNPPDGQTAPVAVTRDGQVVVRIADAGGLPEGVERYTTRLEDIVPVGSLVDRRVACARPCRLMELIGFVNGSDPTAYYYVQLFNTPSAIVNGAVPVLEFPVVQDHGAFSVGYEHTFDKGLVIALSTTQASYTGGTLELWYAAQILTG